MEALFSWLSPATLIQIHLKTNFILLGRLKAIKWKSSVNYKVKYRLFILNPVETICKVLFFLIN